MPANFKAFFSTRGFLERRPTLPLIDAPLRISRLRIGAARAARYFCLFGDFVDIQPISITKTSKIDFAFAILTPSPLSNPMISLCIYPNLPDNDINSAVLRMMPPDELMHRPLSLSAKPTQEDIHHLLTSLVSGSEIPALSVSGKALPLHFPVPFP